METQNMLHLDNKWLLLPGLAKNNSIKRCGNLKKTLFSRYLDGEKLYITVANIGPFNEKVNLEALGITVPETLAYHIVGVSSSHKIK